MKRTLPFLIVSLLASIGFGSAQPPHEPATLTPEYHHKMLVVSTDGFKKLLSLVGENIRLETRKKLEQGLNETEQLLMSDENNIVIVMVWNELVKNMLTYLATVTLLKKHHLDKINLLLKEFQHWLATYAEAHHSEGLIVQEVHHFIEMYRSLAADSSSIPYHGLIDRLEYTGHKCIEWSPLIITVAIIGGCVLLFKPKSEQALPPPSHRHTPSCHRQNAYRTGHEALLYSQAQCEALIKDLKEKKSTFKPLSSNEALTHEVTTACETIAKKEKEVSRLSLLQCKALMRRLTKITRYMELHTYADEELIDLFSSLDDSDLHHEIIHVFTQRYAGDDTKKTKLEILTTELEHHKPDITPRLRAALATTT